MRGLVLARVGEVALRADVRDPIPEARTDAVVAVRAAGLCGSDLHPYEGREPARFGIVQGHELTGEVVAIGSEVRRFAVGDRVLSSFTTSCGRCDRCRRGLTARCDHGQLFGWGAPDIDAAALHGGQAELVRVPLADGTLLPLPRLAEGTVDDATAILLTDNLPTAWEAVRRADARSGQPLTVVGLGSVGLCVVASALALGADPVIAIDPVADRRGRAERLGASITVPPDAAEPSFEAPAVVEAAGTASGQRLAFELVRAGGTLSIIAVQTSPRFAFTPVEAYDRNITVRAGRASVRATLEQLLPRVVAGEVPVPTEVCVTHLGVPLEQGPELYRRFAAREDGLVKAIFVP